VGALYHHFSSKEALYDEVCNKIFDDIVNVIELAVVPTLSPEEKLERFVFALFDEWNQHRHVLILTQRDVISAATHPEHQFAMPHYKRLFASIRRIQSQILAVEVDEATSFAFGSMIFGFCSLMIYPLQESDLTVDCYIAKRRAELLEFCKMFLALRNQSSINTPKTGDSRTS
jgi:AcrR family transcriptional regulator